MSWVAALVTLSASFAQAQDASATGEIHGRVVAAHSGEPVPMGWVVASPMENVGKDWRQMGARLQSDGSFRMYRVPPGQYLLDVRATGYVGTAESGQTLEERTAVVPSSPETGGRGEAVVVRVQRTGTMEGVVLDEDGLPVARCRVVAVAASKDGRRMLRHQPGLDATTDDRGRYRISGMVAGNYLVFGRREGVEFYYSLRDHGSPDGASQPGTRLRRAFHPSGSSPGEAVMVSLQPGEERYGVDIAFPHVLGFSISGVVRNPDGSPRSNLHLSVMSANGGHPILWEAYHARSDERGAFQTEPLAPGQYLIHASVGTERWPNQPAAGGGALFMEALVTVGSGPREDVVLDLHPALRVKGVITHPPISDAAGPRSGVQSGSGAAIQVSLSPAEASTGERTQSGFSGMGHPNTDGRFEIYPLPPGRYQLDVAHPQQWYVAEATLAGQDLLTGTANLRAGEGDLLLRVALRDGAGSINGRLPVEKPSGKPACFLRLFPVADRTGDSPHMRQKYCAPDGTFEFAAVAPNRYKMLVFTFEESQEGDVDTLGDQRWDFAPTVTVTPREEKSVSLKWP
ncbi:MAG: carboxypeptidase regulatory-like domain-containing protein [Bryobacterales bacterium]|nr:carboxypeptidase regulatory-like domain-containing protein [Bryobacterales bacterium]